MEGLYFHCSLSMCVYACMSVCLSVCQSTKFRPNRCNDLDAVFIKWLSTALLKLVTSVWRSRSQWCNIQFLFPQYSLLITLCWISALLCPIKVRIVMSLRYALAIEFDKNRKGDYVTVTMHDFFTNELINQPMKYSEKRITPPTSRAIVLRLGLHKS